MAPGHDVSVLDSGFCLIAPRVFIVLPGHPCLCYDAGKAWMPGTRPGTTTLDFGRAAGIARVEPECENRGAEQERLSAGPGVHVRITSMRAPAGPGIEFLDYLMPTDGRPMPGNTTAEYLWSEVIVMREAAGSPAGLTVRDRDGHALLMESR